MQSADDIITALNLTPHPEGGHYREVHREPAPDGERGAVTSIYYLLAAGERSHWHRVLDAVEIWNFHASGGDGVGGLALSLSPDGVTSETYLLGDNLTAGQVPQVIVPTGWWQSASLADTARNGWVLVGCTVAPAFDFAGFEMAPPDWMPQDWKS